MNLPNCLSFARILLVPVLVVILMTRVTNHEIIGALVFWIAALTDLLDGYLARKLKQVTILGKLLDPLADKLLICGALTSLTELTLVPAWMTFIMLSREMAITGLRGIASEESVTIQAEPLGKWKLGAQIAGISCLILGSKLDAWLYQATHINVFQTFITVHQKSFSFFLGTGIILLSLAIVLAIWSGVAYFQIFWKKLGPSILLGTNRLTGKDY